MKLVLTSVAIGLLSGCAHNQANIWDGELYVSPNGVHRINLDSDELYEFYVTFGLDKKPAKIKKGLFEELQQRRSNPYIPGNENDDMVSP